MDIKNKLALVTGSASGIGLAIAGALLSVGAKVGLVDMSPRIASLADELRREHPESVFDFQGDVTEVAFSQRVFNSLTQSTGAPVQILVPAAGIARDGLISKFSEGQVKTLSFEDMKNVIQVNLFAPLVWTANFVAGIQAFRQGEPWLGNGEPTQGVVIFISSVSAEGNIGQFVYAATKAGLEGASKSLAMEGRRSGIRTVTVRPGYTDTAMMQGLKPPKVAEMSSRTFRRKLIEPAEIAQGVLALIQNDIFSGVINIDDAHLLHLPALAK